MGMSGLYRWILHILILLPLVCQFGSKNSGLCEAVKYQCEDGKLMLVKSAYICSDEHCSKKLYDTPDIQNVWSSCNMRNVCDIAVRHGQFLLMQHDCVLPDETTKGDICGAENLIVKPGSPKFFLHNPGYPDYTVEEVNCTCSTNLSRPVSVTMRYHALPDIPVDESLQILWDNAGGSPHGSSETITPRRKLEFVYQHSNLSGFWIQISVNDSIELTCWNEYPVVILPGPPSSPPQVVLSFNLRIWIILGASSGVICIFIIIIPIVIIFLCRRRKRRTAKLRAWNEMVEKAGNLHATTIQRGTDRIRKLPKEGKTINLYQSVEETGNYSENGDDSAWELVTPSKRRPGALSLNRPPKQPPKPRTGSLPPEPDSIAKDTPYYIYETLPKDKQKNHPYQAIDELESGEEGSIGKLKVNDLYKSKESLGKGRGEDDWSDLYQMASTLGRADSDSPEDDKWKTNDIYQFANLQSGVNQGANTAKVPKSSTAKLPVPSSSTTLPPSKPPRSVNLPDSGRGTLDHPLSGKGMKKSPRPGRDATKPSEDIPVLPLSGSTRPYSGEGTGTAKFPYSPPGTYDNARAKPAPVDTSGYDNCDPDEEWLEAKEREKIQLETAFHDIGKTLSRIKGDIHAFKSLKRSHSQRKAPPSGPEDPYEDVS